MLTIENAFLLDICLGLPLGKIWYPDGLPEPEPASIPGTFLLNGRQLAMARSLALQKDEQMLRAVEGLCREADLLLGMPNPSVTNKSVVPAGAALHDYVSLAKYWWPDPNAPDSRKYILRDGDVNPEWESPDYDRKRLDEFANACLLLAVTGFMTGNQIYSRKAAGLIHTWLIAPETAQTPHFRFAGLIPGRSELRFFGLVEARRMVYVCEALQLLAHIDGVTPADFAACQGWFGRLLDWMETSDQGVNGRKAANNIGFWIDLQRLIYARFCGREKQVSWIIQDFILPRMDDQIGAGGRLGRELSRANPYDYAAFSLLAMAELSAASRHGEIDLAEYSSAEGKSFQNAFNWFNQTVHSNNLHDQELALKRLVLLQRELAGWKSRVRELEEKLNGREDSAHAGPLDDSSGAFPDLDMIAMQSRGIRVVLEQQARELQGARLGLLEAENNLQAERDRIAALNQALKDKTAEVAHSRLELEKLRRSYTGILQSRSWRYGRFLRAAGDWVRNFRLVRNRRVLEKPAEYLKAVLNRRLASFAAILIGPADVASNATVVRRIKRHLYNLGFVERGLSDLQTLLSAGKSASEKALVAWEMILWHADQDTLEGAKAVLELIPFVKANAHDQERVRQIAVIEAEALRVSGDLDAASRVLSNALLPQPDANLFLGFANLESSAQARLKWINQALQSYRLAPVECAPFGDGDHAYDFLRPVEASGVAGTDGHSPLVTVIMPAYNAAGHLQVAVDSVLSQTWARLELLVVDDCSSDATAEIVEQYAAEDSRVRLIRNTVNAGPYVARNLALREAAGEFVTCNDADDWSHPEKIEKQVRDFLENPLTIANMSEQARATPDLLFHRRGKPGYYIFRNMSSFMFRRKPVVEAVGYWDSIRFAGDSEFIRRIRKVFGEQAVVDLLTGPLSFQRQAAFTLTGHGAFGYHGYFMGARKEHFEAYTSYHQEAGDLRFEFPLDSRPFPVPEPLWPAREARDPSGRRHFDVIIVSDFHQPGDTVDAVIEEIKVQKRLGIRTGLIPMARYDLSRNDDLFLSPALRALLDNNHVQMLVYGEKASCDLLLIRNPAVLQDWQRFVPDVEARNVHVVIDSVLAQGGDSDAPRYDVGRCAAHLKKLFGQDGVWHPATPLIRQALLENRSAWPSTIRWSNEDWAGVLNAEEWRRPSRPSRNRRARIGRFSGGLHEWPDGADELRAVYPAFTGYAIHVMGNVDVPLKILGHLPGNWHVVEPGDMARRDFLAMLDVFVYFPGALGGHSSLSPILESMAVGVPVILPDRFRPVFQDAACYADPEDVRKTIDSLMKDDELYQRRVQSGYDHVMKNHGYTLHAARLGKFRSAGQS